MWHKLTWVGLAIQPTSGTGRAPTPVVLSTTKFYPFGTLSFRYTGGGTSSSGSVDHDITGDELASYDKTIPYEVKCTNAAGGSEQVVVEKTLVGTSIFETTLLSGNFDRIKCEITSACADGNGSCTQTIEFDLTCEDELFVDEKFGALTIWDFSYRGTPTFGQCPRPDPPPTIDTECSECCVMAPEICDDAKPKRVNKIDKCSAGKLPTSTLTELTAWVSSQAKATCRSRNMQSSKAPGVVAWFPGTASEIQDAVDELETRLCAAEASDICPETSYTFTCCDPCFEGDPAGCVETTATFDLGYEALSECPSAPVNCLPATSTNQVVASLGANACRIGGLSSLEFQYIGGSVLNNIQSGKAQVTGTSKGLAEAITFRARNSLMGATFRGVNLRDRITIKASSMGTAYFQPDISIMIQSRSSATGGESQVIDLHTSCSEGLYIGNIFGGLRLIGYNGVTAISLMASTSLIDPSATTGGISNMEAECPANTCVTNPFAPQDPAPECHLCCIMGPTFTTPSDVRLPKIDTCSPTKSMPEPASDAITQWFNNHGGATCRLRNLQYDEPVWTAYALLKGAEVEDPETAGAQITSANDLLDLMCSESADSCPTVLVKFKCCDPCSPTAADDFCDEATVEVEIIDKDKPVFKDLPTRTTMECRDQDDVQGLSQVTMSDSVTAWSSGVTCVDFQQSTAPALTSNLASFTPFTPYTGNAEEFCVQNSMVKWECKDDCDNMAVAFRGVTIRDSLAPTIVSPPSDMTIDCSDPNSAQILGDWLQRMNPYEAPPTGSGSGSDQRMRRFMDGPSEDGEVYRGQADVFTYSPGVAADRCVAADKLTWERAEVDPVFKSLGSCAERAEIVWTVSDPCGNSAQTSSTFTIEDNNAPTVIGGASKLVQCRAGGNQAELEEWVAANAGITGSDSCSDVTWTHSPNPVGLPGTCNPSVEVTFTATDDCGKKAEKSFHFFVTDDDGPVVTKQPLDKTVECSSISNRNEFQKWILNRAGMQANDLCNPDPPACSKRYTSTDVDEYRCGKNSCDGYFQANVCGGDGKTYKSKCHAACAGVYAYYDGRCDSNSNDAACGISLLSWDYTTDGNEEKIGTSCNLDIDVTFTVADPCGISTSATATFSIQDTTPPMVANDAADLTVECDGLGNNNEKNAWVTQRAGAQCQDACINVVDWTTTIAVAAGDQCKTKTPGSFVAADQCANNVTTTAEFIVQDTQNPRVVKHAWPETLECNTAANPAEIATFLASRGGAEAKDTCQADADLQWTAVTAVARFKPVNQCTKRATLEWKVDDGCANYDSTSTFLTITDRTAPTITKEAADVNVQCAPGVSHDRAITSWIHDHGGAEASDDCSSFLTWTHSPETPKLSKTCPQGMTVTFTAKDECGLFDTTSARFTVTDDAAPIVVQEPEDMRVECNKNSNRNDFKRWMRNHAGMLADDDCYPNPQPCKVYERQSVNREDCPYCSKEKKHVCVGGETYINMCYAHCAQQTHLSYYDGKCKTPAVLEAGEAEVATTEPPRRTCDYCTKEDQPVCASGVRSYRNPCQAYCNHDYVLANGACAITTTAPSATPTQVIPHCSWCMKDQADPVCGSDGKQYLNPCLAACENIYAFYQGACDTEECGGKPTLDWRMQTDGEESKIGLQCSVTVTANFAARDPCGNEVVRTSTFTIVDTQPPTITQNPFSPVVECDAIGNQGAISAYATTSGGAEAHDSCQNTVTWNAASPVLSGTQCKRIYTQTYTVSDPCNNSAATDGMITIVDTKPPRIIVEAQPLILQCDSGSYETTVVAYINAKGGAQAMDDCKDIGPNAVSGNSTDLEWELPTMPTTGLVCNRETKFRFTVRDGCENEAFTIGSVTVQDTEAPTITKMPSDKTVECGEDVNDLLLDWLENQGGAEVRTQT